MCVCALVVVLINLSTPNDDYSGRTAPLTSKHFILYIYLTNIGTEYFKHGIYSPFFPLQNAVCFIILTYLVPGLFTFYIQSVLKLKKNNSGAKRLTIWRRNFFFLILAHSIYKMWIKQEPNTLELWNKLHFKEKKRRACTVFKIFCTCICWINI